MHYDRQKYERLIEKSVLFTLDKETEVSAYKRESYKMLEYLYCYLIAVNERDYEPYACEIMEVATRCIANFEESKGLFLHYFNAAWKQEFSHLKGDKALDDKLRGLRITEDEKRSIRKYIKLAGTNSNCSKEELYRRISDAMQLPMEKVQLIAELSELRVTGDTISNEDGEEVSVWDQLSDGSSLEDDITNADSVEDLLGKIEKAFNSLQERQKPIVADMLTAKIWTMASSQREKGYSFISQDVLNICKQTGDAPTQRVIADKHGRDEASVSRTVKEFLKKLRNIMSEV